MWNSIANQKKKGGEGKADKIKFLCQILFFKSDSRCFSLPISNLPSKLPLTAAFLPLVSLESSFHVRSGKAWSHCSSKFEEPLCVLALPGRAAMSTAFLFLALGFSAFSKSSQPLGMFIEHFVSSQGTGVCRTCSGTHWSERWSLSRWRSASDDLLIWNVPASPSSSWLSFPFCHLCPLAVSCL